MKTIKTSSILLIFLFTLLSCDYKVSEEKTKQPNILWIYVDDMSDWMGAYGDQTIPTPNIDMLAENGVKFNRAYMPAPVCSATRSAIITGTMQTTLGIHQHRTMIKKVLPDSIKTIPELFKNAGFITFNEEKTDYNFAYNYNDLYSSEFKRPNDKIVKSHLVGHDLTWLQQLEGEKFFGQIQLSGGKWQGEVGRYYPAPSRIKESEVTVPSQYPDTPIIRNAIARHYEQIAYCDSQVGAIIEALKEYNLWDNTAIFFFTDHGSQMPRAKQYVYEEGAKVPLIVHWPKGYDVLKIRGKERSDLVSGIDIATSSLGLAGIKIPNFMEGKNLFDKQYKEREYVVTARDRMGIAIDYIRAVRTDKYLYIKNFLTDRPLYQSNYRDSYYTFKELRNLYEQNKLTSLQATYHDAKHRPEEELYYIEKDSNQIQNLASNRMFEDILIKHRNYLKEWQLQTNDKGMYPIDIDELKKVYEKSSSKVVNPEYNIFKTPKKNN